MKTISTIILISILFSGNTFALIPKNSLYRKELILLEAYMELASGWNVLVSCYKTDTPDDTVKSNNIWLYFPINYDSALMKKILIEAGQFIQKRSLMDTRYIFIKFEDKSFKYSTKTSKVIRVDPKTFKII